MKISPLLLITSLLLMAACNNTPRQSLNEGAAQAGTNQSVEQWHCEGDQNKQWRCRDLSKTGDEPRQEAVAATPVAASPAIAAPPVSAPSPAAKVPAAAPVAINNQYENDNYVVQLIAAREAVTIERFRQQNPQVAAKPLTVEKEGEQWLVLILGTYATYSEAQAAVADITPPLASPPWIRPIAPLRDQLKVLP